jgi:hypothetical protein
MYSWAWLLIACAAIVPGTVTGNAAQVNASSAGPVAASPEPCSMFGPTRGSGDSTEVKTVSALSVGIMPSRYRDLQQTLAGYELSRTPLVAFNGQQFIPAGVTDDPGLYYVVPIVVRTLHTSLDQSITVFYLSILVLAFAIGTVGFALILPRWLDRIVALTWLLFLTILVYKIGDLYVIDFAVPVGLVPWVLWWMPRGRSFGVAFSVSVFVIGLTAACAQFIRLTAGPPVLAFTVILVLLYLEAAPKKKIVILAILLAGVLLPWVYFDHLISERDAFLGNHSLGYERGSRRHHFWHSAYFGLGFLRNSYVQGSCDDTSKNTVRSIDPAAAYLSSKYDLVLRRETLSIARQHPMFVFFTIASKLGIVALVVLIFANVGLLAASLRPAAWQLTLAFWTALVLSAAAAVVAIPLKPYLVGVMSFSTLYGILNTFAPAMRPLAPRSGP